MGESVYKNAICHINVLNSVDASVKGDISGAENAALRSAMVARLCQAGG